MSDIDQHKKELTRIANIEDYDDDSDALDDAGYLLTIACAFEKEIERLQAEVSRLEYDLALLRPVCSADSGGLAEGLVCPTCSGNGMLSGRESS